MKILPKILGAVEKPVESVENLWHIKKIPPLKGVSPKAENRIFRRKIGKNQVTNRVMSPIISGLFF